MSLLIITRNLNCECKVCKTKFHRKPSETTKEKYFYCPRKCMAIDKKILFKGDKNHQFGLLGKLNSSWKSDERISYYGYKLIRKLEHPFKNSDGFVFEHRLVAEKYLLNQDNSIEINGKKYLSNKYVVHHKDFNRLNNNVDNLEVMKKGEHITLHNKLINRERNESGQYI